MCTRPVGQPVVGQGSFQALRWRGGARWQPVPPEAAGAFLFAPGVITRPKGWQAVTMPKAGGSSPRGPGLRKQASRWRGSDRAPSPRAAPEGWLPARWREEEAGALVAPEVLSPLRWVDTGRAGGGWGWPGRRNLGRGCSGLPARAAARIPRGRTPASGRTGSWFRRTAARPAPFRGTRSRWTRAVPGGRTPTR